MKFEAPLIKGRFVKRYKRFFADVILENGEIVVAHCANSGSMLAVKPEGATVWISPANNPKRKLQYPWEIIQIEGHNVGINTAHPNRIVAEAIEAGEIAELTGYEMQRREVKYGKNSRIDIILGFGDHTRSKAPGRIGRYGRPGPSSSHVLLSAA